MAAPQFFTPQRARPSRKVRRFTLEQANATLPLVKRIVADLVTCHRAIINLQIRLDNTSGKEQLEVQGLMDKAMECLQNLVDELTEVGCEVKDYEQGLIDFVGRHENRDIYLCWKLGEEKITHWHELSTGFAGRQSTNSLKV